MKLGSNAQRTAFVGLFGALASVITAAESALPPLSFMPVGAKLGLSNIILMFLVLRAGLPYALAVAVFKSTVVLLTRGITAALMSIAGGVLSLFTVYLLRRIRSVGCIGLSVSGAAAHNIGQLCVSIAITGAAAVYYLPALLIFAVASGIITGIALYLLLPAMGRAIGAQLYLRGFGDGKG